MIKLADVLETEVEYIATGVKPIYQSPPIIVNMIKQEEIVAEKEVKKVIVKPVFRTKYLRNPLEFALAGILGVLLGFIIGLFF